MPIGNVEKKTEMSINSSITNMKVNRTREKNLKRLSVGWVQGHRVVFLTSALQYYVISSIMCMHYFDKT